MASILRSSSASLRSAAHASATRSLSTAAHYFPNEPSGPQLKTQIPGPNNQKATAELNEVFDIRSLNLMADYEKSVGN